MLEGSRPRLIMRLLTILFDRICGQPDLLRHSRSLAMKQIMAIPEEKPERPPVTVGGEVEA